VVSDSRTLSRWWHGVLALVVFASLVLQLVLLFTSGADANSGRTGGPMGERIWRFFSYFTIESNLFALVAATVLARRPAMDGPLWRVVRLDALLGIVITGLVYAIILGPQLHLTGGAMVATIGLHYIAPVMTLAGWLLFGPRPRVTWRTVAAAFVWPVLWLVYTFTQGAFTDWYPYPFLDVTDIGFGAALRNAVVVVVLGLVLAAGFRFLDRRMAAVPR
jgi:hypothetical protein